VPRTSYSCRFSATRRAGLFPELVLIEDTRVFWQTDVFALLEQHGYTVVARNRQNVAYRRAP
jgi:hypothetical protein